MINVKGKSFHIHNISTNIGRGRFEYDTVGWILVYRKGYFIWLLSHTDWTFSNEIMDIFHTIQRENLQVGGTKALLKSRGLEW